MMMIMLLSKKSDGAFLWWLLRLFSYFLPSWGETQWGEEGTIG